MTDQIQPTFPDQARVIVRDYFNNSRDSTDTSWPELQTEEVYVVWFCKTLQNWKALVSTSRPDLMYYEVTYNGNENVVYLDVYVKSVNMQIPLAAPVTKMTAGPKTFTKGYQLGHDDPVMIPGEPADLGGATDLPKKPRGGGSLPNLMGAGKPDQPSPYRTPYD